MPPKPQSVPARAMVRALVGLATVNALLILPLWWRDGQIGSAWLIPELGLLPLFALWPAVRRSRWLPWTIAMLLTFAFAALLGDALVRAVFSRPLNILLDPWLLRAGFNLLQGSLGTVAAVIAAVLAAAGVVFTALAIRSLVGRIVLPAPGPAAILAVMLLAIGSVIAWVMAIGPAPAEGAVRPALANLVRTQSIQVATALSEREKIFARAASARMQAQPIPALAGRDVVLVFVESYGASALDQPRYAETLTPLLRRAERTLGSAGLRARSTRMRSPIRGGQSWLSHATVLSGQTIDNDYWYSMLLGSGQAFLTDDLRTTGHTPLVVAPAIVRPWPEARALGFEAVYPASALAYSGPASGWIGIPDQFTLHRYGRHLRPRHPGPVFATLLLISSHAPWPPNPPLLQDWSTLDRAHPWPAWRPPKNDPLAYWRDTDRLRERYPRSIGYSLEAVFEWAARDLPEDALLIVLGDHQPAPLITGHGAGADVPVHFISADAALLSGIDARGIRSGLVPGQASSGTQGLAALRFVVREM